MTELLKWLKPSKATGMTARHLGHRTSSPSFRMGRHFTYEA